MIFLRPGRLVLGLASSGRPFSHAGPPRTNPQQPPQALDQYGPQSAVTVFVDRTLKTAAAGAVLAGTQPGVAGHLPPVLEAVPIGHLPVQNFRCQFAQT